MPPSVQPLKERIVGAVEIQEAIHVRNTKDHRTVGPIPSNTIDAYRGARWRDHDNRKHGAERRGWHSRNH